MTKFSDKIKFQVVLINSAFAVVSTSKYILYREILNLSTA